MHRPLARVLVTLLISASATAASPPSNEQFCNLGIAILADSLGSKLVTASESGGVELDSISGRFGQKLQDLLAAGLEKSGIPVYFSSNGLALNRPIVKTTVNDYRFRYEGVRRGLFSQSKVARIFSVGASGRVLAPDGRLSRLAEVSAVTVCDTLSFGEARTARGDDVFLSPSLPPTLSQRVVEPGLIVGITGALVYLFFASR